MAKTTRVLAILVAAGALGVGGYTLLSGSGDDDAAGTKRLVNQFWIERLPTTKRDMVGHLALIRHHRGKVGVAGKSSQWRHFIELFEWKLEGNKVDLHFPQDQVHARVRVKTWDCRNEAPAPFEICLEIAAKNRKVVYYSRKDWVIDVDDVEGSMAALAQDNPELAGVFENAATAETFDEADLADAQDWPERSWLPAG